MVVSLSVGVEVIGDGIADLPGGSVGAAAPPARVVADLARRLESAGVSYWVIGAERGEDPDITTVSIDPSLIAATAARHSTTLGLVVAAAGHRDHPYNLARRLVSVDHAAHGRVGWLALDSDQGIALNAATDSWTGAELDATHTADAVHAVRTLWRTWPLSAVVGDRDKGVFADVTQIRRADVRRGYTISGPLNVPGSRQGDLPIWRQVPPGGVVAGADLAVVEDRDPIPRDVLGVVRLRTVDTIDADLDRIARSGKAVGAILRLSTEALGPVLDRILPAARGRGVLGEFTGATLRDRLGLPVPASPDLSDHPVVFDAVSTPGGRL
ncbi:LLM class flavin-dependent oxidoreductase [Mycobacterium sp. 21AC1]|uniref:LLM class flavin-dependent oxidoreductase n=1 Tax=[Mycobacterium] appelbergii TaxID=2939269 RepID=UPI002938F71C|nr:LLM class flavin-dependent oxidoreductase [Mycobacterium sp. 21AC1]MDV3124972.1 LLM class flavin-dependent oxidoreductase [Mycobacterium sp. 21AC1]